MAEMRSKEITKFLMHGTFTGKLATVKKDGSAHVVPIWFVLDDEYDSNRKGKQRWEILFLLQGVHQSKQEIFNAIIE
jgi:nitroimidazol reductase NimA-like FMN-containing flavoprotein (pyridoxamine 5'-phosphate oxidase superfamily)